MQGSGRKKRVYLIEGKRLVQGDPNLVTENEIRLEPVTVDGEQAYKLIDNKGNTISTGDQAPIVVPTTKCLYIGDDNGYYSENYLASIGTLSEYIQWITSESQFSTYSEGNVSIGGEIPTHIDDTINMGSPIVPPTAEEVLRFCMESIPDTYGPFLRVGSNGYSGGDYTQSTDIRVSPFAVPGCDVAYVVDKNTKNIVKYTDFGKYK